MSLIDDRLAELGVAIPDRAAAPAGIYVPAVATGSLVHTAGQLPLIDGALTGSGKVGADITLEHAQECARTAAINALAAVAAVIGSLDRVTRVVKVVGYVASDPEFFGQPAVLNGASELIGAIFGPAGVHARSAVGVAVLPLNSPVEVELVVEFD